MHRILVILTLLSLLTLTALTAHAGSGQVAAVLSQEECAEAILGGAADCEVAHYQANGVRVTAEGIPWVARHGQVAFGAGGGTALSGETEEDGTGAGGTPTPTPTPEATPTPQVMYFPYYDARGLMICDENGQQIHPPQVGEPNCEELIAQGWRARPWETGL